MVTSYVLPFYHLFTTFLPSRAKVWSVLLLKSNSLHITLYFEGLCITVTYYLEIKVTSNVLD